jgi:hypothetical protein
LAFWRWKSSKWVLRWNLKSCLEQVGLQNKWTWVGLRTEYGNDWVKSVVGRRSTNLP